LKHYCTQAANYTISIKKTLGIQRENLIMTSLATVSTDNPLIDPLLYIITREGHSNDHFAEYVVYEVSSGKMTGKISSAATWRQLCDKD
jgi:hypothetical protein